MFIKLTVTLGSTSNALPEDGMAVPKHVGAVLIYCTSYRLNMFQALLCPSSGAHDYIQFFLTLVLFTFCTRILRCLVCIVVSCLVCIVVVVLLYCCSCLVCIVVVVLCVLF